MTSAAFLLFELFAEMDVSSYTLSTMPTSPPSHRQEKPRKSGLDRSIVLIGLMGVGKSTIGRRLAERLKLPFVDSDEEIQKAAGMSVGRLFETYGETHFRDGERRVIARLIDEKIKIIATGGGAFVDDETRKLILEKATAIWLDADLEVLTERVSRRNTRPLLRGKDPKTVLSELATQRNPLYSQAQLRIQSDAGAHEETVDRILKALAE